MCIVSISAFAVVLNVSGKRVRKICFCVFLTGNRAPDFFSKKYISAVPIFLSILQSVISDHNGRCGCST